MREVAALVVLVAVAVAGAERALGSASLQAQLKEHPIEGVITMINDLKKQAIEEGKDEAKDYVKYENWCKDSVGKLNGAIAGEKGQISSLTDELSSLADQIATTQSDIDYLTKQIEEQNAAAVKAKKQREGRHDLYDDEQTNFEDTVKAVDTAVEGLVKAEEDAKSNALLQMPGGLTEKVRAAALLTEWRMSPKEHRAVKAFLSAPTFLQGVPDKKVEDHSGAAVDTFKEMEEDFKVDKEASTEDENHAKNEYNLAKEAREAAIKAAEDARAEKETILGDKKGRKGKAEREKQEQEDALIADTGTLEATKKDCATTAAQFEERTNIRTGEIESMDIAVKILSKVTKVRNPDEHEIPAKLLQVSKSPVLDYGAADDAVGFVQVGHRHHHHHHRAHGHRHIHHKRTGEKAKVFENAVAMLRQVANASHAVHKSALGQLASQLEVYDGPFDTIKAMIQKMVFHLMDEQRDEDQHKDWCDLEVEKSSEEKEDKDQKLKEFAKSIDSLDKGVNNLVIKISENEQKVKDIHEHMKTETKLRKENHAEIVLTIKDSADAQSAIAQATEVLTKFYKDSGMIPKEPWEFLQVSGGDVELPDKPSTWDSSYTGVSDPKNGDNAVLELLSKVNEKFANMEATARVQDTTDQKNYDADMQAKKISLSETEMDTSMKTERKSSMEEKADGLREATGHLKVEFGAVKSYLKDLEPACGEGDSSYDDRKKARTDEIEALRKAQTILEDAFRQGGEEDK